MDVKTNNDVVVKEIPVYLSDDLRHLLLLHYPTRLSKQDQLLTSPNIQCKYKQECDELEITYSLDIENNYDKAHGQELAANSDGSSKNDSDHLSKMIDNLSFESHQISSNTVDMIMYSSGKSLHLCPLKKTLNMLPKLSHINKFDSKTGQNENSLDQNDASEEEKEDEQIMVKFKVIPDKKSKKKKMLEMIKQRAMEPWINLNYESYNQYFSRRELDKFTTPKSKCTYSKDAVQELKTYKQEITNEVIDPIKARQLSHNKIKSYSLENKIKILLFNTKVLSTKMLMILLDKCGESTNDNVNTIVTHLKQLAILVQGNWVIKSEELYPDKTVSFHYGLNFEVMRFLRDYIIHLLDSDQIINRKNIGKMFNSPPEEIEDVLISVAKLDKNRSWKLIETDNDGFLETLDNYQEICNNQKDWWTTRVKQINAWLKHTHKKSLL